MSKSTRRQFLQFLAATLVTLGIDPILFHRKTQRHRQVLAQSTSRKLALLVGINSYSKQPLNGCVNDIYLQRELLIHRFGFNPQDIYILEDKQATRDGILTAFEEYLIKQAQPGDVGRDSFITILDMVLAFLIPNPLSAELAPRKNSTAPLFPSMVIYPLDILIHQEASKTSWDTPYFY